MIKKLLAITIVSLYSAGAITAQTEKDRCNQGNALLNVIDQYHYQPKEINEQFTTSVIKDLFGILDPEALYFIKDDTTKLLQQQAKLKDYLQGTSCDFINLVTDLYKTRLIEADTIISKVMSIPFQLTENDTISFATYKELKFAENPTSLINKWSKWLKFETLKQVISAAQNDSLNTIQNEDAALSRTSEMMAKVKAREKKNIRKIIIKPEGFENYVCSVILNAVAQNFDPHTAFFSKTDKQNFDNMLSKSSYSFGFEIDITKNGEFVIDKIKPGSPAWKSKKLQKGDYLIEAFAQGRPSLDFTNTDYYEATEYMLSSDVKSIKLKVKHPNGKIETVRLTKEKLAVEQNQLYSFILKGEKKIGYIALPDFYVGEDQRSLGCSNDLAKEILLLLKEKIDGLIIDIRFNGGGDLNEANKLSGLFIDEGPLSIMADRFSKPKLIKDLFRGTIYNGPILVMVNGQSASAAEVFAGTLQDYNRAIIFGSQTFGKATAQIVLPIDNKYDPTSKFSSQPNLDMGFVKVTVNKLYRVTCYSHQKIGVTPDVEVPFAFDKIMNKEKDYKTALNNDMITKNVIFNRLAPLPTQFLRTRSAERIKANKLFSEIQGFDGEIVDKEYLISGISLQFKKFEKSVQQVHSLLEKADKLSERNSLEYKVESNTTNSELVQKDKYLAEIISEEKDRIQSDIYIEEAFNVINDLIDYQSKNEQQ